MSELLLFILRIYTAFVVGLYKFFCLFWRVRKAISHWAIGFFLTLFAKSVQLSYVNGSLSIFYGIACRVVRVMYLFRCEHMAIHRSSSQNTKGKIVLKIEQRTSSFSVGYISYPKDRDKRWYKVDFLAVARNYVYGWHSIRLLLVLQC